DLPLRRPDRAVVERRRPRAALSRPDDRPRVPRARPRGAAPRQPRGLPGRRHTPLKRALGDAYRRFTRPVDRAIGVAFDVDDLRFNDDVVRDVDRAALHIEARALGYTEPLDDPPPGWIDVDRPRELHSLGEQAKPAFIAAHHLELSRRSRT